jgi:hypothetical protein
VQGAGVERLMAQACMRLPAGLARAGALPPHPAPFNAGAQRFEQRFAAFAALSRPEPLTHAQFCRSIDVSCARACCSPHALCRLKRRCVQCAVWWLDPAPY